MANPVGKKTVRSEQGFMHLLLGCVLLFSPAVVLAAGTAAGTLIPNTATMQFAIDGDSKNVRSNTTLTRVDEVLDVVVSPEQADTVPIDSPMDAAQISFLVTNTGNGIEAYQLFLDLNVNEGGFDPARGELFAESNSVPGLQFGAGGDTPHVDGAPVMLAADGSLTIHATVVIPAALAAYAESRVRLRAVSTTIATASGVSDPDSAEFPPPGSSFAGIGDAGGNAVVGLTHQAEHPVFFAFSGFRVEAPVVLLDKTAVAVRASDGSDAVRPGSVVDYRLKVEIRGTGTVAGITLTDPLPAELEFVPGSLAINGSPEDDDLEPTGVDTGGLDGASGRLSVALGDVALTEPSGSRVHVVTFSATIR